MGPYSVAADVAGTEFGGAASDRRDWTFCLEAVGPLAADTGGLTYQRNFLAHLDDETRRRMVMLVSRPVPEQLDLRGVTVRTLPAFTATGLGKTLAVQGLLPLEFKRLGVSAVFCSGSIAGVLAGLGRGPGVVVHVQNAAPLQTSVSVGGGLRDLYRRAAVPAGLRIARRVITPSETVKRALIERYGLDPARISAIPLAVDLRRFHPIGAEEEPYEVGVPSPYVLFVSTLWPYKNAAALVSAFAQLVNQDGITHRLVLVGKDGGDEASLRAMADSAGVADRLVFTGHVSGPRLSALYRHADLFVYPSLVESFGFPLLEAMASGVPVVASDRWAIPEICGGAARICDATRVEDLAAAMREVLASAELRADLVRRGLARASEFSWKRTVAETLRVIEDAALAGG